MASASNKKVYFVRVWLKYMSFDAWNDMVTYDNDQIFWGVYDPMKSTSGLDIAQSHLMMEKAKSFSNLKQAREFAAKMENEYFSHNIDLCVIDGAKKAKMHAVEIVEHDVVYAKHSNRIKSISKLATDMWRTVGYLPLQAWLQ